MHELVFTRATCTHAQMHELVFTRATCTHAHMHELVFTRATWPSESHGKLGPYKFHPLSRIVWVDWSIRTPSAHPSGRMHTSSAPTAPSQPQTTSRCSLQEHARTWTEDARWQVALPSVSQDDSDQRVLHLHPFHAKSASWLIRRTHPKRTRAALQLRRTKTSSLPQAACSMQLEGRQATSAPPCNRLRPLSTRSPWTRAPKVSAPRARPQQPCALCPVHRRRHLSLGAQCSAGGG